MSKNTETLGNLKSVMNEIGLADGVMMADIVLEGPGSHACKIMLEDLKVGIQSLRRSGVMCMGSETFLIEEAEETISFFHEKYCSAGAVK